MKIKYFGLLFLIFVGVANASSAINSWNLQDFGPGIPNVLSAFVAPDENPSTDSTVLIYIICGKGHIQLHSDMTRRSSLNRLSFDSVVYIGENSIAVSGLTTGNMGSQYIPKAGHTRYYFSDELLEGMRKGLAMGIPDGDGVYHIFDLRGFTKAYGSACLV